ncbi:MAG: LPS export ABC transporter periplasmic protein LptC [Chitinophagaceae bacterium]
MNIIQGILSRVSAFLLFLLLVSGCENDIRQVRAMTKGNVGVEEAQTILSYYSVAGKVKARMTAPVLYRYLKNPPYVKFPEGLRVDFFNDSLQVQSVLTAKKGYYYENSNKVLVRDSVVVTNIKKGESLHTEELHWDAQKQQFFTDKPVHIVTSTEIINGTGLTSNQNFTDYHILQVTNSQLRVSSSTLPF